MGLQKTYQSHNRNTLKMNNLQFQIAHCFSTYQKRCIKTIVKQQRNESDPDFTKIHLPDFVIYENIQIK